MKLIVISYYFFAFFRGVLFAPFRMPQIRGDCGHLKAAFDTHPDCLSCALCSRDKPCEFCSSWSSSVWSLVLKKRSYRYKMAKSKKTKRSNQSSSFVKRTQSQVLVTSDSQVGNDLDGSSATEAYDPPFGESSPSRGRSSKRSSSLRYASRSKSPTERHPRHSAGKLDSRDLSRGDNTGKLVKDPLTVDVLPATKARFRTESGRVPRTPGSHQLCSEDTGLDTGNRTPDRDPLTLFSPDHRPLDTGQPDTGQPDTGRPDAGQPDVGHGIQLPSDQVNTVQPDTGHPDTGQCSPDFV